MNRDREHQIRRIEDARQRREKEHGRNYVLKAYLSSLTADGETNGATTTTTTDVDQSFEADGAGGLNSDSGVHEGGSSPDGGACCASSSIGTPSIGPAESAAVDSCPMANKSPVRPLVFPLGKHKPKSKREYELFRHHEHNKELIAHPPAAVAGSQQPPPRAPTGDGLDEQIEWLEKIVVINRQLQREEELIVRLNAKLTRCRSSDPSMSMAQLSAAIGTVNSSLEYSCGEAERVQREIDIAHAMLGDKEELIARMSVELHELEAEGLEQQQQEQQQLQVPSSSMELQTDEVSESCAPGLRSSLGDGGSITLAFMQRGTLV